MGPPALAAGGNCLLNNSWTCGEFVSTRSSIILADVAQHVILALIAVGVGFALSIPLSLLVHRFRRTQGVVFGITSVLYSIPSPALFAVLVPLTGLTSLSVEIGLVLYTLVVFVRNNVAGLEAVPSEVLDAARGMGFGRMRTLVRIEAPLALPAVFAGLRVAAVSTVALVTVGEIIGHGGLGALIDDAYNTDFKSEAFYASLFCVGLAISADLILVAMQRVLTPWRRRRSP